MVDGIEAEKDALHVMVQVHMYMHTGIGVRTKVDYGNNAAMHVWESWMISQVCYTVVQEDRDGGEPGRGVKGWAVRCELMGGIGVEEDVIGRLQATVQVSAN